MPDPVADREREAARRHPERETLELAAAGAARVLGVDHGATKALARAALTMSPAVFNRARGRSVAVTALAGVSGKVARWREAAAPRARSAVNHFLTNRRTQLRIFKGGSA